MTGILYRPIVTEKMSALQAKRQYAFEVDPLANRIEISRAVEKKFNVKVTNIRTMIHKGKSKSQLTRYGRFAGRTSHWKKALVTLKEGDKIEFFPNV